MAGVKELPELIQDSVDISKQYLRQETVEPAKRLGKAFGFGFAAAALFGLTALMAGIAVNRWIIRALPEGRTVTEGRVWSGLGYVISALALLLVAGLIIWFGRRGAPEEPERLSISSLLGSAGEDED